MRILLALFLVFVLCQKHPGGPSVPPKPTPIQPDGGEFE
jgi:hypothetical protein